MSKYRINWWVALLVWAYLSLAIMLALVTFPCVLISTYNKYSLDIHKMYEVL
jgi:hypothetical protein